MKKDIYHENYVETLNNKKQIADRIIKTRNHIVEIGDRISKDDNLKNVATKKVDDYSLDEAFTLYQNKGSEFKHAKESKNEIIQNHEILKKDLITRKFSGTEHVKNFLTENNSVQKNTLKKFFKLEKDPLKISVVDSARLSDVANKKHKVNLKDADELIHEKKNDLKSAIDLHSYTKLKSNLKKDQEQYSVNNQKKKALEKPLREMLTKVLDLDFKSLKEFIKENKVNVKTLLAYVKDFISDSLKISNSKIDKNKLENLGKNLEKIDRGLTQEKSLKEQNKVKLN